jgi:hypothetical protein
MRVRADSVFVSCVFHTIALLSLVRPALWHYYSGSDKQILARLDAGFQAEAQTAHYFGVACLTIILVGLMVLWTGYVNRARSAWLVMFAIAAVWAFPVLVLPLFQGRMVLTLSEWLYSAISQPGLPRTAAESVLIFSLMVIALLLPIRSFFFTNETDRSAGHRPSLKAISGLVSIILLAAIALFAWIRIGVVYGIPADMLTAARQLPNPPPPPQFPCKCH